MRNNNRATRATTKEMMYNIHIKIAIVIPCYNEVTVIGDVVLSARKTFEEKASDFDFEVIVINDASRDASGEMAKRAGATVINHILNQGAGGATSTGLRYARENGFDFAVTMDADGQHDPSDVLKCVRFAIENKVDLTIGSRLINSQGMSKVKIIGNKGLSFITWVLFGINVTDSQSGLRVFNRKAATLEWKTTGYEFCSEMLWRASQAKLKVAECAIQAIYTDYSKAKGQNNWNAINIIKSLVSKRVAEAFE